MFRQSGETASFFIIIIEKLVACSFDKTRLPLTCVIFRISSYNFKTSNQFSSIYVPICKIYFVDIFDYFFGQNSFLQYCYRGRHGLDRMVVVFTAIYAIGAYHH